MIHLDTRERNTKQNDARQSFGDERGKETLELVDAPSRLPGQSRDELRGVGVVRDEDGIHEHRLGELALAVVAVEDDGVERDGDHFDDDLDDDANDGPVLAAS